MFGHPSAELDLTEEAKDLPLIEAIYHVRATRDESLENLATGWGS